MAGLTATADTNAVCTAFTPTIVYTACRLAVDIYGTAGLPGKITHTSVSLTKALTAGITGSFCIRTSHSDIIFGTIMILIIQAACYRTIQLRHDNFLLFLSYEESVRIFILFIQENMLLCMKIKNLWQRLVTPPQITKIYIFLLFISATAFFVFLTASAWTRIVRIYFCFFYNSARFLLLCV